MSPTFSFRVLRTDGAARRGEMTTAHGVVQTPAFMPVGTRGAVKGMTPRDLREVGAEIILGNTYHLWLRPGDALIARMGGLHAFTGWDGPILTDSGGFQAFSLGERRVITEDGIRFRSHLDGSEHLLTPEGATDIQARLGPDIAMVLDECLAQPAPADAVRESTERSARWARRCRDRFIELQDAGVGEPRLDRGTPESRIPPLDLARGGPELVEGPNPESRLPFSVAPAPSPQPPVPVLVSVSVTPPALRLIGTVPVTMAADGWPSRTFCSRSQVVMGMRRRAWRGASARSRATSDRPPACRMRFAAFSARSMARSAPG